MQMSFSSGEVLKLSSPREFAADCAASLSADRSVLGMSKNSFAFCNRKS